MSGPSGYCSVIAGFDPAIHPYEEDECAGRAHASRSRRVDAPLLPRRRRPGPLRAAEALERLGHCEHADVVEAAADDLHADGKALCVVSAIDGDGGVFRHIPWYGVADVLEGLVR